MTTFTTPEPITATLTTAGARVLVVATDRPDTVVQVEPIDSTNKSDVKVAEKTKVGFAAGHLSVETVKAGAKTGSVAITVELPAGSRLALSTAWSEVQADGRFGDCTLDVASGQVRLDHIAALRANLAAGSVQIGHIAGPAGIEGGSADLSVGEAGGTVHYEGSTGNVRIGHARSDVDLSAANGSVDIELADADVTAKAANCPIRVGTLTRGHANLMNAAKGIEVGVADGTTTTVDAKSTKGKVRNSLPETSRGSGTEVKVYARTRRDDIVIHAAA